jgi:hypothetical protein
LTTDSIEAQRNVMRFYATGVNIGTGKISPELEAMVQHMLTPEQCLIVQHLPLIAGVTAKSIAVYAQTGFTEKEIETVLDELSKKNLLFSFGA